MVAIKPVTKAKDTPPLLLEKEPLKDIAWNTQSAPPSERPGRRAHPESEKRTSYVRRGSTEPQPSSEEPERQPRKGDKLDRTPGPQEITRAT